jgi:hypothetical protein
MRLFPKAVSLATALLSLALGAAAADDLPNLDPLDPATCDHEKGYVVVAIAWTNAWAAATNSGALEEPRSTQLAVWYTQMENYLLESNDVKGSCLALIDSRKNHKF